MPTQCSYFKNATVGLISLVWLCSLLCFACGPAFVSHDYFEAAGAAGDSINDGQGNEAGSSGETGEEGTSMAGFSSGGELSSGGANPGSGGETSIGGTTPTPSGGSSGTVGGVQEPASCLAHFETDECAVACTHAPPSETGCMQILHAPRKPQTRP